MSSWSGGSAFIVSNILRESTSFLSIFQSFISVFEECVGVSVCSSMLSVRKQRAAARGREKVDDRP